MGIASFVTSKAGGGMMGYLTKGIGSKLIAFVVCIFIFKAAFALLTTLIPALDLTKLFATLPEPVIYGLWYIDAPFAFAVMLPAYATKFFIRRIPVIG